MGTALYMTTGQSVDLGSSQSVQEIRSILIALGALRLTSYLSRNPSAHMPIATLLSWLPLNPTLTDELEIPFFYTPRRVMKIRGTIGRILQAYADGTAPPDLFAVGSTPHHPVYEHMDDSRDRIEILQTYYDDDSGRCAADILVGLPIFVDHSDLEGYFTAGQAYDIGRFLTWIRPLIVNPQTPLEPTPTFTPWTVGEGRRTDLLDLHAFFAVDKPTLVDFA